MTQIGLEQLTVKIPYILAPEALSFLPFRSMTSRFQDIAHFIIPIDYNVKRPKKKKTKIQKNPKFHNS